MYVMKVFALGDELYDPPRFLKAFDLDAVDRYPSGTLELTDDVDQALRFDTPRAVLETWRAPSTRVPLRPDGRQNRPLTVLTVSAALAGDPPRPDGPVFVTPPSPGQHVVAGVRRAAESPTPTPYAVRCAACRSDARTFADLLYLTHDEYMRQMSLPDARWTCPRCGGEAEWDDANYEARMDMGPEAD